MDNQYGDVGVTVDGHVAVVEVQRGPNNFFDPGLLSSLADAFEAADEESNIRALVLASQGKHFCAGANFGAPADTVERSKRRADVPNPLYVQGVRLFACKKPVVGAIHGAAVGGGCGLALLPDFRVVCPQTRFATNFAKLGIHPGFGLSITLPRLIGQQRAAVMFQTGRRVDGETAFDWGMGDIITDQDNVRPRAVELAQEIAENAPLAVMSVRATMRGDIAGEIKRITDHEHAEQFRLSATSDHKEGVKAVAERRVGQFTAS